MPGKMWRLGVGGGVEHPDDSILLAYTRQQNLGEDWARIRQHIAQCKVCLLRCDEFMYSGELLTETLAHFQYSQSYPSLTEEVIEAAQNPARLARRKRQQGRQDLVGVNSPASLASSALKKWPTHGPEGALNLLKSGSRGAGKSALATVSIFSIPLLIGLLLVAVALAFSISTYGVGIPFQPSSSSVPAVKQPNLVVPAHPTAIGTARPANNATGNESPTVTATVTPAPASSQPALRLCPSNLDKFFSDIRLCGSNFTPGDKVELLLQMAGSNFKSRHLMTVNDQGTFQYLWTVFTCKNYIVAISVKDITHSSEVAPALQSAQVGQCFYLPHSKW